MTEFITQEIQLPTRATKASAGYDFKAAQKVVVPSLFAALSRGEKIAPTLVPTGVKAFMPEDEYLALVIRSSNSLKRGLSMPNGIGIVDSDYYNAPANEGHIFFQLINFGTEDVVIEKGERIGQGIFHKYFLTDDDSTDTARTGGFGSSGK
ncbi:dUTP diphosphatase [Enterococcus timonensis]|uniref:dUTP diphosphatase n=1 Tax=Enterococcus timonensis TaxID=1852364 RepID=UPI000A3FCB46|nr:dUTP diphosphatase [Enterococcus timonensis]